MNATAQIVCKPLGTLPLADVPGFPPAVARGLAGEGVATLADLAPHVEKHGEGDAGGVRNAFIELGVRKEHLDQAVFSLLSHLRPAPPAEKKPARKRKEPAHVRGNQAAAGAGLFGDPEQSPPAGRSDGDGPANQPAYGCERHDGHTAPGGGGGLGRKVKPAEPAEPRAKPATDFDQHTPPPLTRQIGEPVPRFVELQPGESVLGVFHDWDRKGRIPAGSVLCDFVGKGWDDPNRSGYVVAAFPELGKPPLGPVGTHVSSAAIEPYQVRVVIHQYGHRPLAVLSPMEAAR